MILKNFIHFTKKELNQDYGIDTKLPIIKSKKLKIINKNYLKKYFNWKDNKKSNLFPFKFI